MSTIKLIYTIPKCRKGLDLEWPCDNDCCPGYKDNYTNDHGYLTFCEKCVYLTEGSKKIIDGFYHIAFTLDNEDPSVGKILIEGKTIPQEWVEELVKDDTTIIKEGKCVI